MDSIKEFSQWNEINSNNTVSDTDSLKGFFQ
jgi:hypothetical protein